MSMHFISTACINEKCSMCKKQATHKVSEEIIFDNTSEYSAYTISEGMRHPFTNYVCCKHFKMIFGKGVDCYNKHK